MRITFQFIVVLSLLFGSGISFAQQTVLNPEYGRLQDQSKEVLSFELKAEYGAENKPLEAIISDKRAIRSIVTDDEGNVYLLDFKSSQIKSFASDGTFRWAVGQEGRGPGDLSNPGYMFMGPGNELYVINNGTAGLRIFDLDGNFVAERIFPAENIYQSYYGALIDSSRILISKTGRPKRYEAEFIILNISEEDLKLENRFYLGPDPEIKLPNGYYFYPSHRLLNKKIAIGNLAEYRFSLVDIRGNQSLRIERDKDVFYDINKVDDEYMGTFVQVSGMSQPPLILDEQYYIKYTYWVPDPENLYRQIRTNQIDFFPFYMNSIDILDKDYNLLYSLESNGKFNSIGEIIHSDGNGHVYTIVTTPYPRIQKYKVSVNSDSD